MISMSRTSISARSTSTAATSPATSPKSWSPQAARWSADHGSNPTTAGLRRQTSSSTCEHGRSPAQTAKRSPFVWAPASSSMPASATAVRFASSARPQRRDKLAKFSFTRTSSSNIGSASWPLLGLDERSFASVCPSNIALPTSLSDRAIARATSVFGRTRSTRGGQRPCRISKRHSANSTKMSSWPPPKPFADLGAVPN